MISTLNFQSYTIYFPIRIIAIYKLSSYHFILCVNVHWLDYQVFNLQTAELFRFSASKGTD